MPNTYSPKGSPNDVSLLNHIHEISLHHESAGVAASNVGGRSKSVSKNIGFNRSGLYAGVVVASVWPEQNHDTNHYTISFYIGGIHLGTAYSGHYRASGKAQRGKQYTMHVAAPFCNINIGSGSKTLTANISGTGYLIDVGGFFHDQAPKN